MNSIWPRITDLAQQVERGEVTALDLVVKSHELIKAGNEYEAILSIIDERSKMRAKEIDAKVKNGEPVGRLAGVPFIAKDNFLTFGSETTAASNILKGFKAPYQATAIERLEAEGAICVAKANMDAFGHGSSTENSDFAVTKNPHDKSRVPGGSSGGPAAAVVLDMAPFAIATDTGGSIRQPASFTGTVGVRPSYGLVSRSGVVAMASSTDTIGPIAKNVEDASLILDVMAGRDDLDGTSIEHDPKGYQTIKTGNDFKNKRIGLIKEYMGDGTDKEIRDIIKARIQELEKAGAKVDEVSLPSLDLALAAYYIIVPAEISSNLSRYDGQHYGYSNLKTKQLDESYNWSRSEGFGLEAKRRIMIGTYVLSSGYYDAYYKKAQQLRTLIIQEFKEAFGTHDYLVGPVAPTTAFKTGEKSKDPVQMYLGDKMTVAVSLVGCPAISVPAGVDSNNLPIGLQIIAPQNNDRDLLQAAKLTEELFWT